MNEILAESIEISHIIESQMYHTNDKNGIVTENDKISNNYSNEFNKSIPIQKEPIIENSYLESLKTNNYSVEESNTIQNSLSNNLQNNNVLQYNQSTNNNDLNMDIKLEIEKNEREKYIESLKETEALKDLKSLMNLKNQLEASFLGSLESSQHSFNLLTPLNSNVLLQSSNTSSIDNLLISDPAISENSTSSNASPNSNKRPQRSQSTLSQVEKIPKNHIKKSKDKIYSEYSQALHKQKSTIDEDIKKNKGCCEIM